MLESLSLEQKKRRYSVKTARVRQSLCMYGCFLCQEAPVDPVVLGIPAIALLGGAAVPAITPPIVVFRL